LAPNISKAETSAPALVTTGAGASLAAVIAESFDSDTQ
jgi:hypothetical protein